MKKELDEQLCKKYPKIFRDRHAPMTQTAMCWGFDCGDGWYNIVDALCSNIQNHIENSRSDRLWVLRRNRALKRAINGDIAYLERYYYKGTDQKFIDWAKDMARKDIEPIPTIVRWFLRTHIVPISKKTKWKVVTLLVPSVSKVFKKVPLAAKQVVASQVKEKYGTLRFYTNGNANYVDGLINMAESMSARTCETCGAPGKTRQGPWIRTLCDEHAKEQGYMEDYEN